MNYLEYYQQARRAYGSDKPSVSNHSLFKIDNVSDDYNKNVNELATEASKRLDKSKRMSNGMAAHTSDVLSLPKINDLANEIVPILESELYGCFLFVDKIYCYRSFHTKNRESSWLWHYDNNPNEVFKIIIYLTDVDKTNGPFEYMVNSDGIAPTKKSSRLGPKHWRAAENNSRIKDSEIANIVSEGGKPVSVYGPRGSMCIFNNNIIHRANVPDPDRTRDVLCLRVRPTIDSVSSFIDKKHTSTITSSGAVPKDPARRDVFRKCKQITPENYYNEEYRKMHPVFPSQERETYAENLTKTILPHIKDCDTILEVGAGDGVLSTQMIQAGKDMSLCEIDRGLSANLDPLGVPVYYDNFTDLPEGLTVDAIIAADVLEHFYSPTDFLDKALGVAKKKLILQLPIKRKVKSPKPLKFDGHYHYYTKKSLESLLLPEWNLSFFYETPLEFTARRWELITVFEKAEI
jgi:hypothetical protein